MVRPLPANPDFEEKARTGKFINPEVNGLVDEVQRALNTSERVPEAYNAEFVEEADKALAEIRSGLETDDTEREEREILRRIESIRRDIGRMAA